MPPDEQDRFLCRLLRPDRRALCGGGGIFRRFLGVSYLFGIVPLDIFTFAWIFAFLSPTRTYDCLLIMILFLFLTTARPSTAYFIHGFTGTEIEAPVSANGQLFYDRYRIAYRKDCYELCFGKSTKLVHFYNPEREKLSFTLSGHLSERISDEEFIIAALSSGGFNVASVRVSLQQIPVEQLQQFDIPRRQEHLEWLKCVKETFARLSVSSDLDCSNLSRSNLPLPQ